MTKLKSAAFIVGIIVMIGAAISFYFSLQNLYSLPDVSDFEDRDVHTFVPYDIVPVRVQNNAAGRAQRNSPDKIVYTVLYKSSDQTGYRMRKEGGFTEDSAKLLYNSGSVEKRVLLNRKDNSYITADPDQTAAAYVAGMRRKYMLLSVLSGGYILIFVSIVSLIRLRKRKAI